MAAGQEPGDGIADQIALIESSTASTAGNVWSGSLKF